MFGGKVMNTFYDYEADVENNRNHGVNAPKKRKIKKKTMIHRIIVIAVCILILVLIIICAKVVAGQLVKPQENSVKPASALSKISEVADIENLAKPNSNSQDPTGPTENQNDPEPKPAPGHYSLSAKEDTSYFDDAVFIGDSVSYGLELYVTDKRASGESCLGNAKFLTSGSLSYANALWDVSDESVHPTYQGKKMKLEESLALIKPKKIYILLGSNDVGLYGVNDSVDHAHTLLSNIQQVCPDAAVIVLATTPKLKAAEEANSSLNNADIDSFNAKMKENCPEWGYIWLDFASQFKLSDGSLDPEYCGDPDGMGIHFLGYYYYKWVDFFEENKVYYEENPEPTDVYASPDETPESTEE